MQTSVICDLFISICYRSNRLQLQIYSPVNQQPKFPHPTIPESGFSLSPLILGLYPRKPGPCIWKFQVQCQDKHFSPKLFNALCASSLFHQVSNQLQSTSKLLIMLQSQVIQHHTLLQGPLHFPSPRQSHRIWVVRKTDVS